MNCIWITTDSFRQDHVSAYRPDGPRDPDGVPLHVETPAMDRLAREGVLFERMLAEALPTVPCRRAVFTGRRIFPWRHEPRPRGLYITLPGWRPLREDDVTVAERLSNRGYVTGFIADTYHLMKPCMNFHRGFRSFEWVRGQEFDQWRSDSLPPGHLEQFMKPGLALPPNRTRVLEQFLRNHLDVRDEADFPSARTFTKAIEWLERNSSHDRFFLYIDTFDPHEPWLVPPPYLAKYGLTDNPPRLIYGNPYRRNQLTDEEHAHLRRRYAALCTMVDRWIGRLLDTIDRLGLRENTLVVLMSDHGKIIGEFGHYGMPAQDMSPMLAFVPCFIRHPGGENAGRRFRGQLYNVDLVATVLDLLGIEPEPDEPPLDGRSVWNAVSADDNRFREVLVTGYGDVTAAWTDDRMLVLGTPRTGGEPGLYDIRNDPFCTRNLAADEPGTRDALLDAIQEVRNTSGPNSN